MKKLIYILISLWLAVHFTACEKDIEKFDNSANYIYFGIPFQKDQYGRDTKQRLDSISHSFALDGAETQDYTFKIAVNTIGLESDQDRSYKVEIVKDSTDTADEEWNPSVLEAPVISKGMLTDTLLIVVKKTDAIKDKWHHLVLRLLPNENFQPGTYDLQTVKICFTNIITAPDWWKKWKPYFGEFYQEKFDKWREIYYLGADPNTQPSGPNKGKQWYWDNMPDNFYSCPSTIAFVQVLKNYFIENEVYPGGDKTKPRITLP